MSCLAVRIVLASFVLLCSFVCEVAAQGPAYRERWGYLHLERRRAEVLDELQGRDAPAREAVATLLAAVDEGIPFRPVADALAYLRGVEADAAFQLRCAMGMFVLPEVVDPDGAQAACTAANFSVYLPFTLPAAGDMAFEISVRDAAGEVVHRELLTEKTGMDDVRLAQAKVSVPGAELSDGAYEVRLRTLLDGVEPRPQDPALSWGFHVLRGYQARAERAIGAAAALRDGLAPLPRAQLDGFAAHVSRVYTGEAFAVQSDAVEELLRLERCLENLAAERAPADGMEGVLPTALPGAAGPLPCLLRDAGVREGCPTVIFAAGAPIFGIGARRPSSPLVRDARWLYREIGDFGRAAKWNLALFDSPGGGRAYGAALLRALQDLPSVLPSDGSKPLLVCDREAAAVVGIQLAKFRPWVSGVVFVGAGVVPAPSLAALGGLPVRFVELSGYPGSAGIRRMMEYMDSRAGDERQDEGQQARFERLHARPTPWPFGVALSLVEIQAFGEQLFGPR